MSSEDVPDSTDWLSTPLSGFAAVEAALRCQVCKDFYTTPVITSCCHTFCSLCIRRALAGDGKCPLCRTTVQELQLRSNWSVEEAAQAFIKARKVALDLARNGTTESASPKRKASEVIPEEPETQPQSKRLRTSARLSSRARATPPTPSQVEPEPIEVADSDDGDQTYEVEAAPEPPTPSRENALVPCPVCQTPMKEWQVFNHLETCTGVPPPEPPLNTSNTPFSLQQQDRQPQRGMERLPALNYSMLKDGALRKKLGELNLPSHGSRAHLEKMHKEWITLWNANCDAARPKKRSELMKDLREWESTQPGMTSGRGAAAQTAAMVKDKNFDGTAWSAKHSDSFNDLIANARRSRTKALEKTTNGEGPAQSDGDLAKDAAGKAETAQNDEPRGDQHQPAGTTSVRPPDQQDPVFAVDQPRSIFTGTSLNTAEEVLAAIRARYGADGYRQPPT